MLKKKDAQGLSTSMIILAVLGLIILFALLYMFMTEQGKTSSTLGSCLAKGGKCVYSGTCKDGTEIPEIECKSDFFSGAAPGSTTEQTKVCCIKI